MASLIPRSVPTRWALGVLGTLLSAAFGAGVSFQLAKDALRAELAESIAKPTTAAAAAQAQAFHVEQELRELRVDLARGAGRCLARSPAMRDEAGKLAKQFYDQEISQGVPPETALQHVFEADF